MDLARLLEELPLDERLTHYRALADEALFRAAGSQEGEVRAGFLAMAAGWRVLAGEIERAMARIQALESEPVNEISESDDSLQHH